MLFHCILVVGVFAGVAVGRRGGPPTAACSTISPDPGPGAHGAQPQAGNGGYVVATDLVLNSAGNGYDYTAGQTYNVQVRNMDGTTPLRGFMVQARNPADDLIGTFTPTGNMQALVNCPGGAGATIGHVNNAVADFFPETFTWTAPTGGDGVVNFRFAVVRVRMTYYANQDAAQVAAALQEPPTIPTAAPTMATTMAPTMTPGPGLPVTVTTPVRGLEDYRITLRTPENCQPTECDLFVGIDTNAGDSDWLDIHIQGDAATWMAVGFSATNNMFSADVLGCNVNPNTGMVDVLDTWNPVSGRTNVPDADAQGVVSFSTSVESGRITCTFARLTAGNNVGVDDLNLDSSLFLMYGIGSLPAALTSFSSHRGSSLNGGNPIRPGVMINPAQDSMDFGLVAATTIMGTAGTENAEETTLDTENAEETTLDTSSAPVSSTASLFAVFCSVSLFLYIM